jgi:hypothetical protein
MTVDRKGGLIVAATGSNQLWTLLPARPST